MSKGTFRAMTPSAAGHWLETLPLTGVIHETIESCETEIENNAAFGTQMPIWVVDLDSAN